MSLEPIGDMLNSFLEQVGLTEPDTAARLTTEWEELAGEPWASRARPSGLRNNELLVDVADAGTLSVFRYRTGELLESLDRNLGEGVVEVIRLRLAK